MKWSYFLITNYNLGQNKREQSTPPAKIKEEAARKHLGEGVQIFSKLRKNSSGPSKTIVWKTREDEVSVEEARG